MTTNPIRLGLLAAAAALAVGLGGCADGYYGGGVATGYYSGPVGYGADYYGGVGYPAYGVYNDFYYPVTGVYVFDRGGHRREWNEDERRHFRGNHLTQNGRFDGRRDHAYVADRNAGFRSFRQGGLAGGQRGGHGGQPGGRGGGQAGGHGGGDRHRQ